MATACERADRAATDAKLVAVSKKQPVEKILALAGEGQVDFGENYPQEFLVKVTELANRGLRWHLIGHLQTNKVKMVVGQCELIHSVDSLSLAETIGRRAVAAGLTQRILLQVNVAGEESKEGWDVAGLRANLPAIAALPGILLGGLMTMPPLQNDAETNRPHFRRLRGLLHELRPVVDARHSWNELSMGTSHDFEVAIEEGATFVRIGTALFGERPAAAAN